MAGCTLANCASGTRSSLSTADDRRQVAQPLPRRTAHLVLLLLELPDRAAHRRTHAFLHIRRVTTFEHLHQHQGQQAQRHQRCHRHHRHQPEAQVGRDGEQFTEQHQQERRAEQAQQEAEPRLSTAAPKPIRRSREPTASTAPSQPSPPPAAQTASRAGSHPGTMSPSPKHRRPTPLAATRQCPSAGLQTASTRSDGRCG
jgi:hypothetical protein